MAEDTFDTPKAAPGKDRRLAISPRRLLDDRDGNLDCAIASFAGPYRSGHGDTGEQCNRKGSGT
jgi:hypothetical protein